MEKRRLLRSSVHGVTVGKNYNKRYRKLFIPLDN